MTDAHAGLAIVDLTVEFRHEDHIARAVNSASLRGRSNKTVDVVGDAGRGKSVAACPCFG
jgi:ABC-type dipeptide/oligopeptide/nickel transport system ATPase component